MCFSATASLTASALLTTAGVFAFKKASDINEKKLAILPLLFGFQQASEGVVWISLDNPDLAGTLALSKYVFLSIAWLVWPLIIPWIYRDQMKNKRMRFMNNLLQTLGISTAILNLWTMVTIPVDVVNHNSHILYTLRYERMIPTLAGIVYVATTLIPPFLTRQRNLFMLGVLQVSAFLLSFTLMRHSLVSVWCFMAAVSSAGVLWVIMMNRKGIKSS